MRTTEWNEEGEEVYIGSTLVAERRFNNRAEASRLLARRTQQDTQALAGLVAQAWNEEGD